VELRPSGSRTDDLWFLDQDQRQVQPNEGWWPLRAGTAGGRIVGGNLCTLNLLQGTDFMPSLDGAVLMLEDDSASDPVTFARDLSSLLQLPTAAGVRGLVVGRFQQASGMTRDLLERIVDRQDRLRGRPVLGNADFGHTNPLATLPLGGRVELTVGATSTLTVADGR
jgi:muramoyltetrapeptide carboxypeptidase